MLVIGTIYRLPNIVKEWESSSNNMGINNIGNFWCEAFLVCCDFLFLPFALVVFCTGYRAPRLLRKVSLWASHPSMEAGRVLAGLQSSQTDERRAQPLWKAETLRVGIPQYSRYDQPPLNPSLLFLLNSFHSFLLMVQWTFLASWPLSSPAAHGAFPLF
jgi:hypothetical protein